MEQTEKGKYICEIFDQIIKKDNNFLNDKTRLYCKYCLSLNKEYVDSINSNLYEDCKNLDMRNLKITEI